MTNPVFSQTDLLKEYVKTLVPSGNILPDVRPRQWGKEFSRDELESIYLCLKFLFKTVNPTIDKAVLDEFWQLGNPGTYIHWFVFRHCRVIVQLFAEHPTLISRKQLPMQ